MPTLKLYSPEAYQVFQRDGNSGMVLIAGEVSPPGAYTIEARFNGGEWQVVAACSYYFSAGLSMPEGQHTLEVRCGDESALVEYVGVGDVYIIAGQSNASGRGASKQTYSHATLKASVFKANYKPDNLLDWTDNPTGSVDAVLNDGATTSAYGSVWPALATHLMASTNVPVMFIPATKGGTRIKEWLPTADRFDPSTLYGAMVRRARWASANYKALLWWQGESDAGDFMPARTYADLLILLAEAVNQDLGCPVVAAQTITMTSLPGVRTWQINRGVVMATEASPYILPGPDLGDLLSDDAAKQHIVSSILLQMAAARWAAALV